MSSSEDGNWSYRGEGEESASMVTAVRKQSLRNITPRSYSSLLKSESEDEEGGEEQQKADKSAFKPHVAAASNEGESNSVCMTQRGFILYACND